MKISNDDYQPIKKWFDDSIMNTVIEGVGTTITGHPATHVDGLETGAGKTRFLKSFQKAAGIRIRYHDFGDQLLRVGADTRTSEMFDNDLAHSPLAVGSRSQQLTCFQQVIDVSAVWLTIRTKYRQDCRFSPASRGGHPSGSWRATGRVSGSCRHPERR